MTNSTLTLQNVGKDFLQAGVKNSVLKNINIKINQAEFVALMGPSGSGKTTLLQIAGLLDSPTSGEIFINNQNVTNADDLTRTNFRKKNIGFVYQFHHLLHEFSAIENVALPLLIQGVSKKESFKKAKELLAEVDLQDRIDYMPSALSGGQQQRVAIARAIITKPSLILADEPTGNLDSDLSQKVFKLLFKLTKDHQISCLIVTHNLELANQTDRIIKIKDGNIIN